MSLPKQDSTVTSSFSNEDPIQRVIRQLVEALLFEKIVDYQFVNNIFCFSMKQDQYQATGKIGSFGRIRLDSGSIKKQTCIAPHYSAPASLQDVVESLPTADHIKNKLLLELQHTIFLCQWNREYLPTFISRRELPYTKLESAIHEGHPYHPCFKSRTGFSDQDHKKYGPESGNPIQLHWLAIRRTYLKYTIPHANDIDFWHSELGDRTVTSLQNKLAEQQASGCKYGLLPIHPWQWYNLEKSGMLNAPLTSRDIISLGQDGDHYQATQSIRTLINVTRPERANVKLSMNLVNTSSLRTIESHSINSAPILNQWLGSLISEDAFLQKQSPAVLQNEYAGISVSYQSTDQHWTQALEDQLGVIFRTSLVGKLGQDIEHSCIPLTAISLLEKDGHPFIHPWIVKYGLEPWLTRLLNIVILPSWHLLIHHGIALEAHAQNTALIHNNGWPEKLVLRDFHESLEYVNDFLSRPDLEPDFPQLNPLYQWDKKDQFYWMASVESLRELFVDTVFVFNLTELSYMLSHYYRFSENRFWETVDQCLTHYQDTLITSSVRHQKIPLDTHEIRTESLMKKKLSDSINGEHHHLIPNSLATKMRASKTL